MSVNKQQIWDALRRIIDPELGCNIVDLGLVYDVQLVGSEARVAMTLTSPGCPMAEILILAARLALSELPGIKRAEVQLVWEPPWSLDLIAPSARKALAIPDE